jgi:hypothetical protein
LTVGRAGDDLARDGDAFHLQRVDVGEQAARDVHHALRDPVMVAQVDEDELPVVALAVDPAGEAGFGADVFGAELAAGVRAIGVHRGNRRMGSGSGGRQAQRPAPSTTCRATGAR